MKDHYLRAVEQVDRVDELQKRLQTEHARTDQRSRVIAALHHEQRNALKLAEIHATLSVGQALERAGLAR